MINCYHNSICLCFCFLLCLEFLAAQIVISRESIFDEPFIDMLQFFHFRSPSIWNNRTVVEKFLLTLCLLTSIAVIALIITVLITVYANEYAVGKIISKTPI